MVRNVMFALMLITFSSCNEFFAPPANDKDDGIIEGTVTQLISNLGIASAHASASLEDSSVGLLKEDFFSNIGSTDYNVILNDGLTAVNAFSAAYPSLATNHTDYLAADFSEGIVISLGFNKERKLLSIRLVPINNGSYSIKDPKHSLISFYKLSFLINDVSGAKYRQSYLFKDGKKLLNNVDFVSSAASIKVTEALLLDDTLGFDDLKSMAKVFKSSVQSTVTFQESEKDMITWYMAFAYSEWGSLDLIQQTVLVSTVLHNMRKDSEFNRVVFDQYDPILFYMSVARPATWEDYCTDTSADVVGLCEGMNTTIENLAGSGAIPSPNSGGGLAVIL